MKEIRALVADDELPARGELTYELSNIPGVKVIGECKANRAQTFNIITHVVTTKTARMFHNNI